MFMASTAIRAPTCVCVCSSSPSSTSRLRPTISSLTFLSKPSAFDFHSRHFSPWNGLKHLGLSVSWRSPKSEKKKKSKCRDRVAYASLFGVGAPEALVIGVVALLVFGPKGLAEVARSLGKTLRAFQPTIRELQEVSREFKSTLEKEIGLDEISSSTSTTQSYSSTTSTSPPPVSKTTEESKIVDEPSSIADDSSSPDGAYTSEELLKVTEEKLKALTSKQEDTSSQPASNVDAQLNPQDGDSVSSEASTEVESNVASSEEKEEEKEKGQDSSPASTAKENAV